MRSIPLLHTLGVVDDSHQLIRKYMSIALHVCRFCHIVDLKPRLHMPITISAHAKKRMRQRGISLFNIKTVLARPYIRTIQANGTIKVVGKIGKKRALAVVYEQRKLELIIVTTHPCKLNTTKK
jgi:hypothetical protein